jgi:serine/threonine protein kinase/Tol biopolymer transport system component
MIGETIAHYRITAKIGEGGMGEVYRATDTRLGRDVALKFLPDHFADDPDRLARFQREAQVLASLNHPNIAQIYGLEESGTARCIVMELVDGETLADRVARGPIPAGETLNLAHQIAEALEAAHERGIIHRDLKPANVKVTRDGKVKVLDFGLAKAFEGTPTVATLSNSPTLIHTLPGSNAGVIIGTAAYMSPEQARGFAADQRSDVFSFGCVLYEMLTGKQAFHGDTVSDILASVLAREPNFALLPAKLNPKVSELLRRSLEKNPRRRWYAVGDLRLEIEAVLTAPTVSDAPNLDLSTTHKRREWAIGVVAVLAIVAFAVLLVRERNRSEAAEVHFHVVTPPTADATSIAVSPDGRKLVFVGSNQGRSQLFLRPLDSVDTRVLPGTEGAAHPFWSPNSRSVAFFAGTDLKRVEVPGGPVQVVLSHIGGGAFVGGGTWNQDDVILFMHGARLTIFRVAATGGTPVQVTDSPRAIRHTSPYFLPDGRHFLFYAQSAPETQGVYWGDLESKDRVRLLDSDSAAVYSPSGYLLFIRESTLFAQRFDAARRRLLGDPFPVAEQAALDPNVIIGAISAGTGVLAYRTGSSSSNRQLVWFDRSGKPAGDVGPPDGFSSLNPELSPDGGRVAVDRVVNGNRDVWVLELARHITSRFTFDPTVDLGPVWAPDGDRIVFTSARRGVVNLYLKSSNGAGNEDFLLESPQATAAMDWSRDGRFIIYRVVNPNGGRDLWVLPLFGDRKPYPFVATSFNASYAQFSPDGRWVAYQSDESGQYQIYVQPFPGPGAKLPVSNAGGTHPRWNRNGKELFYIAADSKLMSVAVETTTDSHTLKAGTPVELFATHLVEVPPSAQRQQYAVSPDGQRFLMNVPIESADISPITVVLNWNPGTKK